ncbi:FmdB family zinc ribbon protein [Deferrisoma camini]|uniref:FmdB family zinc ribbon protein n=1 Tax=Deferrisoma camini TaxID=1035120 RepID=UPI00046D78DD|nr:zinc ribbon domain-containing protein [Deferrisoma camini]
MPVYEFYCPDCHVIFNFLARRPGADRRPDCPRCGREDLERRVSLFAISKGRKDDGGGEDDLPDIDETRLEQAMESLAAEADSIDEDDPRQVARLMRKLYDATGMNLGPGMEEAIRRMEAGEDPDRIEEEMGDVLEEEDPFTGAAGAGPRWKALKRRLLPPEVDDTLYEL